MDRTRAAVVATTVSGDAGSPGHPDPAGTGDSNGSPVLGCGNLTPTLCTPRKMRRRRVRCTAKFGRDTS
jgi:hypothetical protein